MTFATRTFAGMSQGSVLPPNINVQNTSASAGIRNGGFSLAADGTVTKTNASGDSTWYSSAPVAGIGSNYWVKLTINSSVNTSMSGSATGTVLALSGAPGWSFANNASNKEGTGSFTLTFYSDSGGTSVVGTNTGTWDVGTII